MMKPKPLKKEDIYKECCSKDASCESVVAIENLKAACEWYLKELKTSDRLNSRLHKEFMNETTENGVNFYEWLFRRAFKGVLE